MKCLSVFFSTEKCFYKILDILILLCNLDEICRAGIVFGNKILHRVPNMSAAIVEAVSAFCLAEGSQPQADILFVCQDICDSADDGADAVYVLVLATKEVAARPEKR